MLTIGLLLSVFLGSLVSGWHCALMCGGIAAAVEGQATSMVHFQRARQLFYLQLTMHLGRITTYTLLGGIAAWVGIFVWRQDIVLIQRPLFFISSSLLIFMGIRLLLRNHPQKSPFGKWLGLRLATSWAKYLGNLGSSPARWFSGMLWGLLPCGLIYSVLPLAFLSGNVLTGMALMFAFGLGTLPNLILISRCSALMAQLGRSVWVRYLASALLMGSGLFGIYRAWVLPQALLQQGFCFS
jgi:sulfite exporter TauE/SafE